MIYNKDVIIISSIDWDFIWQGHQEISTVLAKNKNRILFVENTGVRTPNLRDIPRLWSRFLNWKKGFKGIRKQGENIYIYSPLVLPFPYSRIAIKINKFIMLSVIRNWAKIMEFKNPIVLSFLPTGLVRDMLNEMDPSIFIYYCIDNFESSSKGAKRIKNTEELTIRRADLVFTTSRRLYDRCRAINADTHLFPFGVNIENYGKARETDIDMPKELTGIKRPIIGYVGGMHKWVDLVLLKNIALARKDISLVLIGPRQADLSSIEKLDNIFLLGKKEPSDLPKYVKFFDAGIIPYLVTEYTKNVYPTKINEYLAMGKAVISTRIPEVEEFDRENGGGLVYFINGKEDAGSIMDRISLDNDPDIIRRRIDIAKKNSWGNKINSMCDLIEKKIQYLEQEIGKDWLAKFKKFYLVSRRKAIKSVAILFLLYFVFFHSPLVWFLASPLTVEDKPKRSDAIVVIGGGIGEGGRPGSDTLERARYSAELYNGGYGDHIVFSSGYTYKYNDAENMMLIATSMGVPRDRIVLEQKGGNEHENVGFIVRILKQKEWNSIILITSPYNMLRTKMLFDKLGGKNIAVLYCPIKNPEFYIKYSVLRLNQLRGILHEYLAILYYMYKGYV